MHDEAQQQVHRMTAEKELWEQKFEQKRRALKEIESSLTRQVNDLEKDNAMLSEKLRSAEEQLKVQEDRHEEEMTQMQNQLNSIDDHSSSFFYSEDALRMKQQIQELEQQLQDV